MIEAHAVGAVRGRLGPMRLSWNEVRARAAAFAADW